MQYLIFRESGACNSPVFTGPRHPLEVGRALRGPLSLLRWRPSLPCNRFVDSDRFSRERFYSAGTLTSCETLWYLSAMWPLLGGDVISYSSQPTRLCALPIKPLDQFQCLGHFCCALNEGENRFSRMWFTPRSANKDPPNIIHLRQRLSPFRNVLQSGSF